MITVRSAVPDDAPELVRLREVMFASMQSGTIAAESSGDWKPLTESILRSGLSPDQAGGGRPVFGVFVVDDEERPGRLAACAVGTLEQRLPAPGHPDGLFGFVFNICTDPDRRRRGYARACTEALLDWFDKQGATRLDLHASPLGQDLYRALGFTEYSVALSRTTLR
ncbi:GNAT family N-acetyltransferase [Streptacidiphilus pinicola]|uniref:GNAT family N-acetyltransferase n=1 Tax=Streptacidiphilus pinicola TaxID=2219663 RepID=A0A2X0IHQ6_9ACTN|nr:GNAT family N-acetyltransferase [Streptacidiphilus pinicola]RAG84604.1 GNAT family N-acetyltransferase [Streptacidiphilus pinicola]